MFNIYRKPHGSDEWELHESLADENNAHMFVMTANKDTCDGTEWKYEPAE